MISTAVAQRGSHWKDLPKETNYTVVFNTKPF